MEEPGRLQFKESQRIRHNWARTCTHTYTHTHTHTHTHLSTYTYERNQNYMIKVVFSGKPKTWHISFNGMDGGGWTRITALYPKVWASPVSQWVKKICLQCWAIGDAGLIPGFGRSPGWGHGNSLQYSCFENPIDRGAWWAAVHRVTLSQILLKQLSTHAP